MSDKGKQEQPPMAVLNGTISPSGGGPLRTARLIIVVLSLLVVALAVLLLRPVKLDVYKTNREIKFADPVLARCVDEVTVAHGWRDVGQIVSLRCNNPASEPIHDISGIEHLVALTDLNLAFNAIDNVEPIAQLPRLKVIELSHNRLSQLPAFRAAAIGVDIDPVVVRPHESELQAVVVLRPQETLLQPPLEERTVVVVVPVEEKGIDFLIPQNVWSVAVNPAVSITTSPVPP